jgi:LysM repeat protein
MVAYTVKPKDSWWRIAATTYGTKNADAMIPALRAANPDLGDQLKVGQKLQLPKPDGGKPNGGKSTP